MNRSQIKGYCLVAAFTVLFYLGLSNLHILYAGFQSLMGLLTPFIIGIVLAFLLGDVMKFFERLFSRLAQRRKRALNEKWVRPISLLCTYLTMFALIAILLTVVLPQVATSVVQLGNAIPGYLNSLQELAQQLSGQLTLPLDISAPLSSWLTDTAKSLLNFVMSSMPRLLGIAKSFSGGIFNTVIGLVVAAHILLTKEKLLSQATRINRAFVPQPAASKLEQTAGICAQTFSNYVSGQLIDALLVGVVSVIGLSVFGFPYPMLVGVIMGITNIIPFFGPIIGAIPGFLIILMADPIKALWYILFVVIVQQVDGNFIAPKIIGGSVGLPPIWVLFAVTVGGAMFGVVGMVLGTPLFAVLYILLGQATRAREREQTPDSAV